MNTHEYLGDDVARVKEDILCWIKHNKIKPGQRLASQNTFVKLFKCSHTTVHKAMRSLVREGIVFRKVGHGSFLAHSLSKPVIRDIRQIYPDRKQLDTLNARILICSIIKDKQPPLNSPAYEILAMSEKVIRSRLNSSIEVWLAELMRFQEFVSAVREFSPSGIIVDWKQSRGNYVDPIELEIFAEKANIPIIHCFHYCEYEYPLKRVVELNNSKIALLAISHLKEFGHNNIALACPCKWHGFEEIRVNAIKNYSRIFGINLNILMNENDNTESKDFWEKTGFNAYQYYKQIPESERPTALLAINDKIALSFIDCAKSDSLKIPDDISVVGIDNNIGEYVYHGINLTSVDPCRSDVGSIAANWLIDIFSGNGNTCNSHVIRCEPKLFKRATVALLKSDSTMLGFNKKNEEVSV